ncbi:MAG TPA: hypothetical protein VGI66_03340 [Streptosporangiaceae bacterium]
MDQKSREDGYRAQNGPGRPLTAAQLRRSRHKLNHALAAAGLSRDQVAAAARLPEASELRLEQSWGFSDIQRAALERRLKAAEPAVPKPKRRRRRLGTQGGAHRQPRRQGRG